CCEHFKNYHLRQPMPSILESFASRGAVGPSTASSAGHGVHRPESIDRRDAGTQMCRIAPSSCSYAPSCLGGELFRRDPALTAWHGVHRSKSPLTVGTSCRGPSSRRQSNRSISA